MHRNSKRFSTSNKKIASVNVFPTVTPNFDNQTLIIRVDFLKVPHLNQGDPHLGISTHVRTYWPHILAFWSRGLRCGEISTLWESPLAPATATTAGVNKKQILVEWKMRSTLYGETFLKLKKKRPNINSQNSGKERQATVPAVLLVHP